MGDPLIEILLLPAIWIFASVFSYKRYENSSGKKDFWGAINFGLWTAILIGGMLYSTGLIG